MNKQYKQFNFFGSVVVMAESQKAAERQLLKVMAKNAIGCSFSLSPPQAPVSGFDELQHYTVKADKEGEGCYLVPVESNYERALLKAADVKAAQTTQPPTAELLALPDKLRKRHETVRNQEWTYRDAYDESADKLQSALAAESELRGLEQFLAEHQARNVLCLSDRGDGWLVLHDEYDHQAARYLELRGLLERHPDNPDLVRLKPEPQEGE